MFHRCTLSQLRIDGTTEQESDFDKLLTGLFIPSCSECHGTPLPAADIALTSYDSIMAAGIVKVGDSVKSDVYDVIKVGYMPYPPYQVAPGMLEALACWIDRGALKQGNVGCFASNIDRVVP